MPDGMRFRGGYSHPQNYTLTSLPNKKMQRIKCLENYFFLTASFCGGGTNFFKSLFCVKYIKPRIPTIIIGMEIN